jgi:hypothetical protein
VLGTDALTGTTPPFTRYDDAAAAPNCPPNASVTTSVSPAKSKPYGVWPDDGNTIERFGSPSASSAIETIELPARSVTISDSPCGANAIWAGLRARDELSVEREERHVVAARVRDEQPLPVGDDRALRRQMRCARAGAARLRAPQRLELGREREHLVRARVVALDEDHGRLPCSRC